MFKSTRKIVIIFLTVLVVFMVLFILNLVLNPELKKVQDPEDMDPDSVH